MTKTVGQFTYDTETDIVTGPAEYMKAQGNDRLDAIAKGTDPVFPINARYAPDIVTAILVTIQTDYAAWHGMETFNRARGI